MKPVPNWSKYSRNMREGLDRTLSRIRDISLLRFLCQITPYCEVIAKIMSTNAVLHNDNNNDLVKLLSNDIGFVKKSWTKQMTLPCWKYICVSLNVNVSLPHLQSNVICYQGPKSADRSDAATCGVWPGSALFVYRNFYAKTVKV